MNNVSDKKLNRKEQLRQELAQIEASEKRALEQKQKAYVNKKDAFVTTMVKQFIANQEQLKLLKDNVFTQGLEIHQELYEVFQREPKENQKSFSIQSEDKLSKIILENAERLVFDEKAEVGIDLMHDVLKKKFETRNKGMYQIIDKLLSRNSQGDYDPKLLVKLRQFEADVNEPDFTRAIDILTEAQVVDSTSLYVRAYTRVNITSKWKDISLQFSSL